MLPDLQCKSMNKSLLVLMLEVVMQIGSSLLETIMMHQNLGNMYVYLKLLK